MVKLFQGLINRTTGWILNLLGVTFLFLEEGVMALVCFFVAMIIFIVLVVEMFAKGE